MASNQPMSAYALGLPELVLEIGKYLTTSEVVPALQVCKQWQAVLQPQVVRGVYISYPDALPPPDFLSRYSWNIRSITIVERQGRTPIEYFELIGCTALSHSSWKSVENPHNLVTDSQWSRMIRFVNENRMKFEGVEIEYSNRRWMGFWETFSRNPMLIK